MAVNEVVNGVSAARPAGAVSDRVFFVSAKNCGFYSFGGVFPPHPLSPIRRLLRFVLGESWEYVGAGAGPVLPEPPRPAGFHVITGGDVGFTTGPSWGE